MSQHNRKDPRAKVLSMTVRYRSATLSEFIEHHSYDVSRGGLFIKTPSPFPPGTLLKFEVKIAEDQRVMQGVGRVVWKRDAQVNHEEPAGMGIKFIKLDEASKAVIEQLVRSRGDDTVSAFDRSPDSKSYQTFPALEDTLSEDPTVVRTRADLFPTDLRSHLETPGSGVNQNLSIPVPSGPALSLGQGPVSLPQDLESAPISQQMTIPGGLMSPLSGSSAVRSSAQPMASGAPGPVSAPPGPLASPIAHLSSPPVSVTPERASKKPAMSEAPYRKPGPVPVHSAPPPKSNLGYLLLVVVALAVGGAFLYLRMNPQLLHSRPSGTPAVATPKAPPKPSGQPGDTVDASATLPAGQGPDGANAAPEPPPAAPEAPANAAPAAEVQPSGTHPTDAARPTDAASPSVASPTEGAAAPVPPTTPAPTVTPRPVVRKAKPKATATEPSPETSAANEETEAKAPSDSAPASEAPSTAAPAEQPPATTPAPSPAPPTPQPSSEEEFR